MEIFDIDLDVSNSDWGSSKVMAFIALRQN